MSDLSPVDVDGEMDPPPLLRIGFEDSLSPPVSRSRPVSRRKHTKAQLLEDVETYVDNIKRSYSEIIAAVNMTQSLGRGGREATKLTAAVKRMSYGLVQLHQVISNHGTVDLQAFDAEKRRLQGMVLRASLAITDAQEILSIGEEAQRLSVALKDLLQNLADLV